MTLAHRIERQADKTRVVLTGDIAAGIDASLDDLVKAVTGGHVELDCSGIGHINSVGVRSWRSFLKKLDGKGTYEFSRCPVFFVDYANMIPELLGSGGIVSFEAPMKCSACKRSATILLDAAKVDPKRGFGQAKCKHCAGALEPEVDPDDYLAFLDPLS